MDFDNIAQVGAMDKEGLDVAILYPSRGLFVLAIDGLDPELAAAIAKAYNDWLYDFCKLAPIGCTVLPSSRRTMSPPP